MKIINFLLGVIIETAPYPKDVYETVLRLAPDSEIYPGDKDTTVHEAIHGLNAQLRMKRPVIEGKISGAFYIPGKFIWLKNPDCKITDLLPTPTQTNRIKFYSKDQFTVHWNDQPLYVVDELVAYTWGLYAAIQELEKNQKKGFTDPNLPLQSDVALAIIEFSYLAEKIYDRQPTKELREIIDWCYIIFHESQKFKELQVKNPWEKYHAIPNPLDKPSFSTIGNSNKR